MIINRHDYIEGIAPFIGQPLVKILSGVRRCGKSTIFEMLKEKLLASGIEKKCIISKRYTGKKEEMAIENVSRYYGYEFTCGFNRKAGEET